jgi:hypothetical protein
MKERMTVGRDEKKRKKHTQLPDDLKDKKR